MTDFEAGFNDPAWESFARSICDSLNFPDEPLFRAPSSDHVVFLRGESEVVKIFRPGRNCFERELRSLRFAAGRCPFRIPGIVAEGVFDGYGYLVQTRVPGRMMTREEWLNLSKATQFAFVRELAEGLRRFHACDAEGFDSDWNEFVEDRAATLFGRQAAAGVNRMVLDALPRYVAESLPLVPRECRNTLMHADVHFGNLRVDDAAGICGLFDFADSRCGFFEYEFLAVGVLMIQGQGDLQREFFRAYGYSDMELDAEFRRRLMMLTMLYESADLRRYALRLAPEAVDWPLERLERGIWSFCDQ